MPSFLYFAIKLLELISVIAFAKDISSYNIMKSSGFIKSIFFNLKLIGASPPPVAESLRYERSIYFGDGGKGSFLVRENSFMSITLAVSLSNSLDISYLKLLSALIILI